MPIKNNTLPAKVAWGHRMVWLFQEPGVFSQVNSYWIRIVPRDVVPAWGERNSTFLELLFIIVWVLTQVINDNHDYVWRRLGSKVHWCKDLHPQDNEYLWAHLGMENEFNVLTYIAYQAEEYLWNITQPTSVTDPRMNVTKREILMSWKWKSLLVDFCLFVSSIVNEFDIMS